MGKLTIKLSDPLEDQLRDFLLENIGRKYYGYISVLIEFCVEDALKKFQSDSTYKTNVITTIKKARMKRWKRGGTQV